MRHREKTEELGRKQRNTHGTRMEKIFPALVAYSKFLVSDSETELVIRTKLFSSQIMVNILTLKLIVPQYICFLLHFVFKSLRLDHLCL